MVSKLRIIWKQTVLVDVELRPLGSGLYLSAVPRAAIRQGGGGLPRLTPAEEAAFRQQLQHRGLLVPPAPPAPTPPSAPSTGAFPYNP